jgi:hypothetical protein
MSAFTSAVAQLRPPGTSAFPPLVGAKRTSVGECERCDRSDWRTFPNTAAKLFMEAANACLETEALRPIQAWSQGRWLLP